MFFNAAQARFDSILSSPRQSRVVMFLCGAIYPLAFAPFEFWPLVFLSLIPLLLALQSKSALSAFKLGFYWGLGAFSVGASWVFVSIHEFGFVPWPGALLMTAAFVAFLALFKGFFAYGCHRLLAMTSPALMLFIAPTVWWLSEYLQSVVFGGFPWLLIGYSQIDTPLASLASWFGVYGLGWLLVAIIAGLSLAMHQRKKSYGVAVVILISIGVLSWVENNNASDVVFDDQVLDVALIQPNVPQEQKWDRQYFSPIVRNLLADTEKEWGAELIVWPEGAIPAYAHQVEDIFADLKLRAIETGGHLMLGIPDYKAETSESFVAMKVIGQQSQNYFKQVLVPFGEYVPLQDWLRGAIKFLDLPMSGFTPGNNDQLALSLSKLSLLPAICYEIVYPAIVRQLANSMSKDKPGLIVTVSNDAWFGDSFGPYQHMQMARMRALELGLPLVRATNDGITAVVDRFGNILKQLPRKQRASLRYSMPLTNRTTYYRKFGDLGLTLLLLISSVFILWSIASKRGTK